MRLVRVLVAGSVLGDGIVGIILIDLVHGLLIHGLLIHGRVVHVEHGLHGRLRVHHHGGLWCWHGVRDGRRWRLHQLVRRGGWNVARGVAHRLRDQFGRSRKYILAAAAQEGANEANQTSE